MERKKHDGEIEYCERCGRRVDLTQVDVSEADEFACPACGHEQYTSDHEDADEEREFLPGNPADYGDST